MKISGNVKSILSFFFLNVIKHKVYFYNSIRTDMIVRFISFLYKIHYLHTIDSFLYFDTNSCKFIYLFFLLRSCSPQGLRLSIGKKNKLTLTFTSC